MENSVNSLLNKVVEFQYNPSLIQRSILETLREVTNGEKTIVDPTNPFVFGLEAASVLTAAFMMKDETNTRRQYPLAAQTNDDLYIHMSDKDYLDRFATPAKTTMSFLLPLAEVIEKMVLDQTTGIRKIVIPRNTYVTVIDTQFSIQYPVEIRQLQHGGIQIIYDTDIKSPLQDLTTNVIDHEIRTNGVAEWIYFELEVFQFSIISHTNVISAATDFSYDMVVADNFYYARLYVENASGKWEEIKTTHTEQVYDVTVPTAVLKITDKNVNIRIPQVYTSGGLLSRNIRMDVYQTKGEINAILSEYPFDAFTTTWQAYDKSEYTEYVAPLKVLSTTVIYSNKTVIGGTKALTFSELRNRVIKNAVGVRNLPITNVQIETHLEKQGYQVVKNVDNVTNRIFLATKPMPLPVNQKLITPANSCIKTLSLTFKKALLNKAIIDNGDSITLTPDVIYKDNLGILEIVTDDELNYIGSLPNDRKALIISNSSYLYTPFHYVVDASDKTFECRPYYFDNPEIKTKVFNDQNDTTLLQVNTKSYSIERTVDGFKIRIVTQSGDSYKELPDTNVHVQLAFIPPNEKDYAYLNGVLFTTLEDGERVFDFVIKTNFNTDKEDNLYITNFLMYTFEPRYTRVPMDIDFNIVYSVSSVIGYQWQFSPIDKILGRFALPSRIAGVTHETLKVKLGYSLKRLWARARSVIDSITYETHDIDILQYYEQDVLERDATGSAIKIDATGRPVFKVLHKKGDPVLDSGGTHIVKHAAGSIKLDSSGNPLPTNVRGLLRQFDIMLIEAAYKFSTDATSITYRNQLTQNIVSQITTDFETINKQLLEQTRIYYYPKTSLGLVDVLIGDTTIKSIEADQSFEVTLYVPATTYSNINLREQLVKTTIKLISDGLTNVVVSIDDIVNTLKESYGEDVVSVKMTGIGGSQDLQTITLIDNSKRCSVKKRLTSTADGKLIVEEAVSVIFVRYQA